jgi:hypothetical protein
MNYLGTIDRGFTVVTSTFLSVGGIKCDIPMFRGRNGHMKCNCYCLKVIWGRYYGFFSTTVFTSIFGISSRWLYGRAWQAKV